MRTRVALVKNLEENKKQPVIYLFSSEGSNTLEMGVTREETSSYCVFEMSLHKVDLYKFCTITLAFRRLFSYSFVFFVRILKMAESTCI